MKSKINQVRVTVPKWIAELKDWNTESHLEIVPQTESKDKNITKDVVIIIKEVKKDG
ncbi:MAG TPA: hypothetical protein P5277_00245 [Candidatus Paceibacterota bacterium]|nr:hypothetical protein [Candidatus Paceibacterota bacterium]